MASDINFLRQNAFAGSLRFFNVARRNYVLSRVTPRKLKTPGEPWRENRGRSRRTREGPQIPDSLPFLPRTSSTTRMEKGYSRGRSNRKRRRASRRKDGRVFA